MQKSETISSFLSIVWEQSDGFPLNASTFKTLSYAVIWVCSGQIQDDTSTDLALVHSFENAGKLFWLRSGEVSLHETTFSKLQRLNGFLAVSNCHTNNRLCLGNQELWVSGSNSLEMVSIQLIYIVEVLCVPPNLPSALLQADRHRLMCLQTSAYPCSMHRQHWPQSRQGLLAHQVLQLQP